jgi:hypothetical protein
LYYYVKTDDSGWVLALKPDNKTKASLCSHTKVQVITKANGRTLFKVCDGPNKDQSLSMSNENAALHLSNHPKDAPAQAEASLTVIYKKRDTAWYSKARNQTLDQQLGSLAFLGKTIEVTLNSDWGGSYTPIAVGEYKIRIPDSPHDSNMTAYYRKVAPKLRYDQVWFPIEHGNNSRYVHVGNVSDGCVTVVDLEKWNDVYSYLIRHRTPGGKHVGKLIVKLKAS